MFFQIQLSMLKKTLHILHYNNLQTTLTGCIFILLTEPGSRFINKDIQLHTVKVLKNLDLKERYWPWIYDNQLGSNENASLEATWKSCEVQA